jgi:hypothetical protein
MRASSKASWHCSKLHPSPNDCHNSICVVGNAVLGFVKAIGNSSFSHFEKEQPGVTHYLALTKLEGFGIADALHTFYLHCHQEEFRTKGGNNVASMLIKTPMRLNIMKVDNTGNQIRRKELNVSWITAVVKTRTTWCFL